MSPRNIGSVALAIILSYVVLFTIPVIWMAAFAALPFLAMKRWWNSITGFCIGIATAVSVYLIYPMGNLGHLSAIMGSIAGVPSAVVLLIYPLIYGVIFGLSALLWSGIEYSDIMKKVRH